MSDRGWQPPGGTRPLPAVRPTTSSSDVPELFPFHTKDGATLWLTKGEVDHLRLREFASDETGEISYLAAMDFDGEGNAHYPPAHIKDVHERLDAEAKIRGRCKASREEAKDSRSRR